DNWHCPLAALQAVAATATSKRKGAASAAPLLSVRWQVLVQLHLDLNLLAVQPDEPVGPVDPDAAPAAVHLRLPMACERRVDQPLVWAGAVTDFHLLGHEGAGRARPVLQIRIEV